MYDATANRWTYYKTTGTYSFRLEAMLYSALSAGSSSFLWAPVITATFYPRSYGTVANEPAEAGGAQENAGAQAGPGGAR